MGQVIECVYVGTERLYINWVLAGGSLKRFLDGLRQGKKQIEIGESVARNKVGVWGTQVRRTTCEVLPCDDEENWKRGRRNIIEVSAVTNRFIKPPAGNFHVHVHVQRCVCCYSGNVCFISGRFESQSWTKQVDRFLSWYTLCSPGMLGLYLYFLTTPSGYLFTSS